MIGPGLNPPSIPPSIHLSVLVRALAPGPWASDSAALLHVAASSSFPRMSSGPGASTPLKRSCTAVRCAASRSTIKSTPFWPTISSPSEHDIFITFSFSVGTLCGYSLWILSVRSAEMR